MRWVAVVPVEKRKFIFVTVIAILVFFFFDKKLVAVKLGMVSANH